MKQNDSIHQCLSLPAIKAYLSEEISEQERIKFKQHFASCALCEEVRKSFSTVNEMGVEEDIVDLQDAVFETIHKRKITSRRLFLSRVAAGVLLPVLGIAAYFYWNNTENNRLYQTHFESYLLVDTNDHRGGNGIQQYESVTLPKELQQAINLYKAKQYKASIPYFDAYRKIQSQNTKANFYLAMAHLEVGTIQQAIPILEEVRLADTNLKEDASWYLALAQLKKNKPSEAKRLLTDLKESNFYSEKANQLLQKL